MWRLWSLVCVVLSIGCSLLYGDQSLRGSELGELRIEAIEIYEGEKGVPVLVHGRSISRDAEVVFELAEPELLDGRDNTLTGGSVTLVSSDGSAIARSVNIPVLPGLADGQTTTLIVRIRQQDDDQMFEAETTIAVLGLDELDFGTPMAEPTLVHLGITDHVVTTYLESLPGDTPTSRPDHPSVGVDLRRRFSEVICSSQSLILAAASNTPFVLDASDRIDLSNVVLVAAGGSEPGPGGCGLDECESDPASGLQGPSTPGFGCGGTGGGHGGDGGAHAFTPNCPTTRGGAVRGNRYLTPSIEHGGRAGGAGGRPANDEPGPYAGGAGGGVVALTAARILPGFITVAGGAGEGLSIPSVPPDTCAGQDGAGGGGSGGAVLLRTNRLDSETAQLDIDGGTGGRTAMAGSCNGLAGGRGRLRVDGLGVDAEVLAGLPFTQGPTISVRGSVVGANPSRLSIQGSAAEVPISVDDAPPSQLVLTTDGILDLNLESGIRRVCAWIPYPELINPASDPESPESLELADIVDTPEAKNCIRLAVVRTD